MLFRLLGLLVSFFAGLMAIAVLSRQDGASAYASFALIASLLNLLPFADLGLGASVVNAVSDMRATRVTRETVRLHVSRARDVLCAVGAAIAALSVAIFAFGGWPVLLGAAQYPGVSAAATVTMALLGLSLPLGLGARMLQGLGSTRLGVQVGLLGPASQIASYTVLFVVEASASLYLFIPGLTYFLVNVVTYLVARRKVGFGLLPLMAGWRGRRSDPIRLSSAALPFFVISVALAVGFQSHRLVLAWFGSDTDLAQYALAAQFAGPILALITVAAQNLWSQYKSSGESPRLQVFVRHLGLFSATGILAALALSFSLIIAPGPLTAGTIELPALLIWAAGFYVVVVATHQPAAMLLTSPRGLWFQAATVSAASAVAFIGMIPLVSVLGAAAPYLAFATSMALLQVIPTVIVAVRKLRRGTV